MVYDALLAGEWLIFLQAFVMLFAIFDPIGNLPIFFSLTAELSEAERKRVASRSSLVAFAILVVFAYGGMHILRLLQITINDFKIVSGIILLVFAVEYVLGRGEKRYEKAKSPEEIAVFPLATPLLAGPGSISVVMLTVNPPFGPLTTFTIIVLNVAIAWVVLSLGARLRGLLGYQGAIVISRIMGLIIGAIAISFIRDGVIGILKSLEA
ncbi:MAG: MarC family protein [Candidatus Hecatellaceae archaeon]